MATHCYKCNHDYKECAVRSCPHPAVQKRYGDTICLYCCRGCKHVEKSPFCGGIKCGYITEEKEGDI